MRFLAAFLLAVIIGSSALSEPINFGPDLASAGWSVVTFPGIAPARFRANGTSTIEVGTDAAVGLLWRAMKGHKLPVTKTRWSWRVDESVGATDLTQRGKDDRALAVYFVFGRHSDAVKSPMALLSSSSVRTLAYVFGGDMPRGSVLPSPHMGQRGKFIILQSANGPRQQWLNESVDLVSDFTRVFGQQALNLLAVAISSDSDDTRGRNRAQLRDLQLGD